MRQFLRRQLAPIVADDLFLRVFGFLGGIVFGALGVFMLVEGASHERREWLSLFGVFYLLVAVFFIAWGGLLLCRCVLPAKSRMARFAEKVLPDASADLGDSAFLLVVFLLPAVLLTLLLRLIGVRGQRTEFWKNALSRKAKTSKTRAHRAG